mmetsp:Transcript_27858/g.67723  ORF Transcript_27858/g.67723 Transcript_27858/m.67723 type:complete len:247 (+) Transcript_27858:32-772(+)
MDDDVGGMEPVGTEAEAKKLRILYLHGFEENEKSPKPASLKPHVEMHLPPLGVYLNHHNSPIRFMLTSPYFYGPLIGGLLLAQINPLMAIVVAGAGILALRKQILVAGIRGALGRSLEIARNTLKTVNPDAVVAFSWGGCLACLLLREGAWRGPTLLLAPAYDLILEKAMLPRPQELIPADQQRNLRDKVLIVHSDSDQIVPIEKSKTLAAANGFLFEKVSKEKHAMFGLAQGGKLLGMLRSVAKR